MKKLITTGLLFICFFGKLNAQINWQTDFETARKIAFKTGKKILIECFHPECTHCIALNENLKNPTLANYLNDNYTNIKLDLTNLEQVKLLESKNIRLLNYPIFLFFDNDGNFQYFIEPRETPEDIIKQFEEERGNSCIDCENTKYLATLDKVRCATFYRLSRNYEKSNAICNKFFRELPEIEKTKLGPWTVFKKAVYSTNNDFFNFYINNQDLSAGFEGNNGKEKDVFITIIQQQIKYLENKKNFPKWEIDSLRSYLSKMGGSEKQQLTWLWSLELGHYLNANEFTLAKSLCNRMSDFYPDITTYGFLSERINDKIESNEMFSYFLEVKDKWFAGLKEDKQKLQYYKQAAIFFGKNKDKKLCLNALNQAASFGLTIVEKSAIEMKYLN